MSESLKQQVGAVTPATEDFILILPRDVYDCLFAQPREVGVAVKNPANGKLVRPAQVRRGKDQMKAELSSALARHLDLKAGDAVEFF